MSERERVESAEREGVPLKVFVRKYMRRSLASRGEKRVDKVAYEIEHAETGETVWETPPGRVYEGRGDEYHGQAVGYVAGWAKRDMAARSGVEQ